MGKKKNSYQDIFTGYIDLGKSTTTGRLIYKCDGIYNRTTENFENEALELARSPRLPRTLRRLNEYYP
uniref:Tr-type G domain-containing protein n=1 Tax=Catagonus wagneri TaxID=51154 RepID=A0A8C3WPF5_9CETA